MLHWLKWNLRCLVTSDREDHKCDSQIRSTRGLREKSRKGSHAGIRTRINRSVLWWRWWRNHWVFCCCKFYLEGNWFFSLKYFSTFCSHSTFRTHLGQVIYSITHFKQTFLCPCPYWKIVHLHSVPSLALVHFRPRAQRLGLMYWPPAVV